MPSRPKKPRSSIEEQFALQLRALGVEGFCREHRFHPVRRWRFDFAWQDHRVAAEIEGLSRSGMSRHQTIKGYRGDLEKYNEATRLGWRVFRFDQQMVKSGQAIDLMIQVLGLAH